MSSTVGPRNTTGWHSRRFNVVIRNTVRETREACGMKSSELAQRLGIQRQHLDYIEHQQVRPTVDLLARCAEILGVSPWSKLVDVEWLAEHGPLTTEEILSHAG